MQKEYHYQKYQNLIISKIKKIKTDLLCHKNIISLLNKILKLYLNKDKDNNNYFNKIDDYLISYVNEIIKKYIKVINTKINKLKIN